MANMNSSVRINRFPLDPVVTHEKPAGATLFQAGILFESAVWVVWINRDWTKHQKVLLQAGTLVQKLVQPFAADL